MSPATRRELAVDGAAVAACSVAICLAAHELTVMTLVVGAAWAGRLSGWLLVQKRRGRDVLVELAFCVACTALGAVNDWRSVDGHHVYRYLVPTDLAGVSSLPAWMLAFWGLILRFLATLTALAPATRRDRVRLGARGVDRAWLKIGVELALVIATRQAIYRAALDPVWSWLPFLVALAVHALFIPWDARDRVLVAVALAAGPAVEILFIRLGRLHEYDLGWVGGVPVWIILWWALAVLVWRDLAPRLRALLGRPAALTAR